MKALSFACFIVVFA